MNRTPRLSESGIEYLDYTWNFYSGCWNRQDGICAVENCWAKGITERFSDHYPNGFEPTYYPEAFCSPVRLKKPSIIGCAFMGDLFGDWIVPSVKFEALMPSGKASVSMSLKEWIFTTIRQCPQHRFLFLTKQPQNLIKWSPFPSNCRVGVTATDPSMIREAFKNLKDIEAKVKYISFEPLQGMIFGGDHNTIELFIKDSGVNWVIIGAQTKPYKPPKIEWVQEIVEACDKARIPVFLKDNLRPLLEKENPHECYNGVLGRWQTDGNGGMVFRLRLRQEMPGGCHGK